jgi:lipoprotein-anchoring transpeptidase ErfK/SrfK
VHVALKWSDGSQFGVGIPIIAFFSKRITDAKPLADATKVTVNGTEQQGAWYFETSTADPKYPIEGHYRLQNYWPAHAQIHLDLPVKGLSAGKGLEYDDSLTLDFETEAAQIATVLNSTHTLTLKVDGRVEGTYPVSLGANDTRTLRGTKVIMEKGKDISMRGPGYFDAHVKFTQRLTYGGEYLHSAPWNCLGSPGCVGPQHNIGSADSSNGCTNLRPIDAEKLYGILRIGDVVMFPDANGRRMQIGEGYGDWNVSWSQWLTGGLVPTH